jgi:hypothetical protein
MLLEGMGEVKIFFALIRYFSYGGRLSARSTTPTPTPAQALRQLQGHA